MKKIIIIGNGGHSKVVQNIIKKTKEYKIVEIWDDIYQKNEIYDGILHKKIARGTNDHTLSNLGTYYFISIGDNNLRKNIVKKLNLPISYFATIIHPDAIIDEQSTIASGSLVMANAVIQNNGNIGNFCIVNTSSVIDHDSTIGSFSHVGPNATITGGCTIGSNVLIGAGSVVIPSMDIGNNAVVGAGSVVIKPIPANSKAYGNPARIISKKDF